MPLRGKGKRKGKSENYMQGLSGIEEEMMNYVSVVGDGGSVSGKKQTGTEKLI